MPSYKLLSILHILGLSALDLDLQLSEYRIKMSDQEDMVALGRWTINRRLLPIKLFYFFMMAGEYTYSAGLYL